MGWEGCLDPVTSSSLQFSLEAICLASSKRPDSSTERVSSSQRQLKACSAVISHLFVLALGLAPHDDVAGSVSKECTQFIYGMNLTLCINHKSGDGRRRVV